ncbi:MAG: ADP-ribosylglycohydrolase family protein [Planctomycetota bacterium]
MVDPLEHRTKAEFGDRFEGALLGLALGDALGAPHEGGPFERLLWRFVGRTRDGLRRWTDDTQMTLDIVDSLVECKAVELDDLAARVAKSYRWSRGYGPGATKVLKRIRRGQDWRVARVAVYTDGSHGNGAAMRSPAVGLYFHWDIDRLWTQAGEVAAITHAHHLAVEGAQLIAVTTALSLFDEPDLSLVQVLRSKATAAEFIDRLEILESWIRKNEFPVPRQVGREFGRGMAATESVVTAISVALLHRERAFEGLVNDSIAIGGDVDTIAAMAGAIWGACNGASALPQERLTEVEGLERLRARSKLLLAASHDASRGRSA